MNFPSQDQWARLLLQIAQRSFSQRQIDEITYMASRGKLAKEIAQQILEGKFEFKGNILFVPDVSANDLIAVTNKELNLTFLDPNYAKWNFYMGVDGSLISGRGKWFEIGTWKPDLALDAVIQSEEVRQHFRPDGFYGHAAAFTQWRRTCGLQGYHASILEDVGCWRDPDGRDLYVPSSGFVDDIRGLDHSWVDDGWGGRWVFVAFRELS